MGHDPHLTATSQGWTNGSCLLAFQVTSNEKLLESLRNTGSLLQALERLAPAHRYEEPSSGQNHFCPPLPPSLIRGQCLVACHFTAGFLLGKGRDTRLLVEDCGSQQRQSPGSLP